MYTHSSIVMQPLPDAPTQADGCMHKCLVSTADGHKVTQLIISYIVLVQFIIACSKYGHHCSKLYQEKTKTRRKMYNTKLNNFNNKTRTELASIMYLFGILV